MLFHTHRWQETGRAQVTAASHAGMKAEGTEAIRALMAECRDRTAIHLKCSTCGEVQSRLLDGWIAPTLPAQPKKQES